MQYTLFYDTLEVQYHDIDVQIVIEAIVLFS